MLTTVPPKKISKSAQGISRKFSCPGEVCGGGGGVRGGVKI